MGGSIAIAARFNDGEAICIDGWTNFIPRMVMNATTLAGDDAVVRSTMMEAVKHKAYDGPQPFRARGYGMVVIDFVGRVIHTMQGYTTFDRKMLEQLLDINASGWRNGVYSNVLSAEAEGLLDAGRVRHVATNGLEREPITLTRATALEMLDAETRAFMEGETRNIHELLVLTAPFELQEYPERGSLAAMKERLRADGFPITTAGGLNAMLRRGGQGHDRGGAAMNDSALPQDDNAGRIARDLPANA